MIDTIELAYVLLIHVDNEVLLGLELEGQLVGGDLADRPLLGLGDLLAFHSVILRMFLIINWRDFRNFLIAHKAG